jgi:hypothetical protein
MALFNPCNHCKNPEALGTLSGAVTEVIDHLTDAAAGMNTLLKDLQAKAPPERYFDVLDKEVQTASATDMTARIAIGVHEVAEQANAMECPPDRCARLGYVAAELAVLFSRPDQG